MLEAEAVLFMQCSGVICCAAVMLPFFMLSNIFYFLATEAGYTVTGIFKFRCLVRIEFEPYALLAAAFFPGCEHAILAI